MRTKLTVVLAPALLAAACFYPADRGRALEARVQKLTDEQGQLASKVEKADERLEAAMPQLDKKIAEVTAALENLDKASRRSSADVGVQMQKAVEDVATLRGQVETYLHKIEELESGLKRLSEETDQRLIRLQGEDAVKAADAKRRADDVKRPSDAKEYYELARSKLDDDPLLARVLLLEFLKKWPKDPRAGEAHFAVGETYRGEDKCREALASYGRVIQEYPKTASAPAAYLRSSDCFGALKMKDESRLALEELVKSYPKSAEAKDAKAKLAALDKAKPAPKKPGSK